MWVLVWAIAVFVTCRLAAKSLAKQEVDSTLLDK